MIYCPNNWLAEIVPYLQGLGLDRFDIVLSESQMGRIDKADFCYQWDCYRWRGNPEKWIEIMRSAKIVACPSQETADNTLERYGIKCEVIKIFIPMNELRGETKDDGYVFQGARNSPEIRWQWLESACQEVGLPLVKASGELSREDYLEKLRNCHAVVSTREEASTGGLCLFEGAMFDKPLLTFNTKSAREYFGDTIEYFNNYAELVSKIPNLKNLGARKVVEQLTVEKMARQIYESLHRHA